jgi:hypothetical protein
VDLDALTIGELRSAAIYTDSDGNGTATLDALKDGVTSSGGVTYGATAGWHWTQIERPLLDRYKTITVSLSSSATIYIGLSQDGTTWTWYYGGTTNALQWLPGSTTATEATAQAGAVGVSGAVFRIDLPALAEARYIRLGHRHPTVAYTLREFYARRLVQSDDIEAESIRGINIAAVTITGDRIAALTITATNIAASTITADKLSVTSLSAITANVGTLTSGTIDGVTIRAGSGDEVLLDANGIGITGDSFTYALTNLSPVVPTRANAIEWTVGSGQKPSIAGSSSNGQLLARGQRLTLAIPIGGSSTANYGLDLQSSGAHRLTATSLLVAEADATAATAFKVTAGLFASGCSIETAGGVNIGTASGAGVGEFFASASNSGGTVGGYVKNTGGTAASTLSRFSVGQTNAESAGLLLQFAHQTDTATVLNRKSSTGTLELQTTGGGIVISNDGGVKLTGKLGVNNTTPISKPTVTGSRGGNAALASLLTALANYGLITDSSS